MTHEAVQTLLSRLEELTTGALQRLYEMTEEEFEAFTVEREQLVMSLLNYKSQITEEDRTQINKLLEQDPIILNRMHFLKDEAGKWLEHKGAVRVQQNAYQRDFTPDSLFLDYRK